MLSVDLDFTKIKLDCFLMKAQLIKEQILRLIEEQRRAGGQRLEAERQLAKMLGCSRSLVVKVLGDLETEGQVIRKTGSGTFVRRSPGDQMLCIGLIMRHNYNKSDIHFRTLVTALCEYAATLNIRLQIFDNTSKLSPEEYENCEPVAAYRNHRVDGFMLLSRLPLALAGVLAKTGPTVSLNNIFGDGQEIPCITCDYFQAGYLAGRHLLLNGHRRIAYLTEDMNHSETFWELSGFRAALSGADIPLTEDDILESKQSPEIFFNRCVNFFSPLRHTACFVRNLRLVRPLLAAFKKMQADVADHLTLVAVGNYYGEYTPRNQIQITTIDTRLSEMASRGVDTLLSMIKDRKQKTQPFQLLQPILKPAKTKGKHHE